MSHPARTIQLDEPTPEDGFQLQQIGLRVKFHNTRIRIEAFKEVKVETAARDMRRRQPDSEIEIIKAAKAFKRVR